MSQQTSVRLTMLGATNCGKTTYMTAMYAVMRAGVEGFTFSCRDADLDLKLEQDWERLIDPEAGAGRWPEGTVKTNEYHFQLNYGYKPLVPFDWLDYRGGALKEVASNADVEELRNRLLGSSCVLLCVSGEHLAGPRPNVAVIQAQAWVGRMNDFMTRLRAEKQQRKERLPTVMVVITKYDRCQHLSKEQLLEMVRRLFSPLFTDDSRWLVAVCQVTLGNDLASDPVGGAIDPQHVHYPISFAICRYLQVQLEDLKDQDRILSDQLAQLNDGMFSRLWNRKDITTLGRMLGKNENEMQAIQEKVRLLGSELKLSSLPLVFNGKEMQFDG
jgi:hypothetical protein